MHIRQLFTFDDNQSGGESKNQAARYLENLQSICFPSGITQQSVRVQTHLAKALGTSPNTKKLPTAQIDQEALEDMKQHSLGFFTITTNLGLKRYLAFLQCFEPRQTSVTAQFVEYSLNPFALVIVMSEPAFKFAGKVLKGMQETSLVPYYSMLCTHEIAFQQKANQQVIHQPLRLEFLVCFLFSIINKQISGVNLKVLEDLRENGRPIVYEETINNPEYHALCPPNISFKTLFHKLSSKIVIQLVNCLLLQRKIILISKDPLENSLIIEALLELLSPIFNKCVFLNIPYLKAEMIDYIDSPVPFVIGVEESVWNKLFMRKWPELQDDTVCFDLETELLNSKVDIPSPPEPMHSMIQAAMTEVLSRHHSLTERQLRIYVKQAFFNYFLLLINDIRLFKVNFTDVKEQDLHVRDPEKMIGLNQYFKFQQYLDNQPASSQQFYEIFIETQLFNDFIERSLRMNQDQSLSLYFKCLDILQLGESFSDLLDYQQQLIDQVQALYQDNQQQFTLSDLLETYERVIGSSAFIKNLGGQILTLDQALVKVNLFHEVQKQSYIKSLIKKPIASKKTKPSKKTSNTVFKQSLILAQTSTDSRNLSANKESSQYLSAVYFQKGPQKVSTPKGLPSEIKTMSNFLSEDESKSTNSKDQKNSIEENKSETSSIKSFFKSTLEKIQNKLRNNKGEEPKKDKAVEAKSLMIDCAKFRNFSLTGLVQVQRYNDVLLKSSDSFKFHNKSIFSPVFGQTSEFNYGRPKCYSETASSKVKGIMSSGNTGPGNLLTQIKSIEQRNSNKSYHESPKSFGQAFETFDDHKLKSDFLAQSHSSLMNPPLTAKSHDSALRFASQKETQFSTHVQGMTKQSAQHSYPIIASGMVIVKDPLNNTKRIVKNININLEREDERSKKQRQKGISIQQQAISQMTSSFSNQQLLQPAHTASAKTLNSSRSGGNNAGQQSASKLINGSESPADQMASFIQKSSEKKGKLQASKLHAQSNSGGKPMTSRQKAISLNQTNSTQPPEQKKTPQQNFQTQSSFKIGQQKQKNSMKAKRDLDFTKQSLLASQNPQRRNTEKQSHTTKQKQDRSSMITFNQTSNPQHQETQKVVIKPTEVADGIEGFQGRVRSISYQMSHQEFNMAFKQKQVTKQLSTKNLIHKGSPCNSQKEEKGMQKSSSIKSSKVQLKLTEQMLLLQPKSHLQTFNEMQGAFVQQSKHPESDELSDSQANETSHVHLETPHVGLFVQTMNAAVGYINQSIVRSEELMKDK